MKIDLHCHTIKVKAGERTTRNVTPEVFADKIRNADIKIVGITNHNVFDFEQYKKLVKAVGSDCQVWPGVELNINGSNGDQWHLIVVSNPDTVIDFQNALGKLTEGFTPETCMLDIEDVVSEFAKLECFYIPHYHKTPQITEEDSKKLLNLVGDNFKILNETSDIRSMGVLANHNYRVVIGSDVHDWSKYEESTFSELRLPVESFHQLYLLAKRDFNVVQTLLNKNPSKNLEINFLKNVKLQLNLYNEINVIFGPKGTGKSEILEAIKQTLEKDSYSCASYIGTERDVHFNQLLKTDDMPRHVGKVGSMSGHKLFQDIREWEDSNATPISDYLEWLQTKDTNANKQRMKITLANTPIEPSDVKYDRIRSDAENIKRGSEIINRVDTSAYLTEPDARQLSELHSKLEEAVLKAFRNELIDRHATRLSKQGIELIKHLADKKTGTKSPPGTTGFSAFANNRLGLYRSVSSILENISNKESRTKELIGSIEGKGEIYVQSIYRMECSESKTEEFGNTKIKDIRAIKKILRDVEEKYTDEGVYHQVSSLNAAFEDAGITSTEQFLGISRQIVLGDKPYKPSNGEKSILMMQRVLDAEKDVYIFDEPELGMGNSYIDENIRPRLSALGKSKKIVIIATHNANIAVRTLPYATIFRDYDDGTYKTYVGNPFVNSLVNIVDSNDAISWKDTSMRVLEGGVEAFYERKDIYESRNS